MGLRCNGRLRQERDRAIRTAMVFFGGNRRKAALHLGVSQSTITASLSATPSPWVTDYEFERGWHEWELELNNKLLADEAELLQRLLLAAIKRRE